MAAWVLVNGTKLVFGDVKSRCRIHYYGESVVALIRSCGRPSWRLHAKVHSIAEHPVLVRIVYGDEPPEPKSNTEAKRQGALGSQPEGGVE